MKRTILFSQKESGGAGGSKRTPKNVLGEEPRQKLNVLKMLQVEDDAQVQRMVLRMAKGVVDTSGVRQASSAEEAMGILNETQDFDLILLDLRMQGMGGIGFVRKLVEAGRRDLLDKIVITTGTPEDIGFGSGAEEIYLAVGGRIVNKPMDLPALQQMLRMVADGRELKECIPKSKE